MRRYLAHLGSLPFFEAAGRHGSFAMAAEELHVTPAAVAHRIKMLEEALGVPLFDRVARGVRLTRQGRAFLRDIQRILEELRYVAKRHRSSGEVKSLTVVTVEMLAVKWLMPRLAQFTRAHPNINIEFEIERREVERSPPNFDVWIAFTNNLNGEPHVEPMFEETLVPVCSPSFMEECGKPAQPDQLVRLPLLYELTREDYWSLWFASHAVPMPDLSNGLGFRLYSMTIEAAVQGMGVALGFTRLLEPELEQGTLVTLYDSPIDAPARYVLVTAPGSKDRSEVKAFRAWVLDQARGHEHTRQRS